MALRLRHITQAVPRFLQAELGRVPTMRTGLMSIEMRIRDSIPTVTAPVSSPRRAGRNRRFPLAIVAAILLGVVVRAVHVLLQPFPLNDGGLFYVMVQDLQRARYHLPAFTSYNADSIPFAYPPLGLYVSGLLSDGLSLDLLTVFRFLPLIVSCLTIPAFFLLARSLLDTESAVVAAVAAFALIPRGFIWMIMGGGITRSFGLLFAILTLWQAHMLYTRRTTIFVLPTALFAALTLLSHPETGKFVVYSIPLFFLVFGRDRRGLFHTVLIAVGMAAMTAPWWITVVAYRGLDPFLAANATGISIFSGDLTAWRSILGTLLGFGITTSEPFFPLIGGLALLGARVCLVDAIASLPPGRLAAIALPLWWGTIIVLDNRASSTFNTLPIALLAGIGVANALLPLLRRAALLTAPRGESACARNGTGDVYRSRGEIARQWSAALVLGVLLCYAAGAASLTLPNSVGSELRFLVGLSQGDRAAMQWVAQDTPSSSQFLVIDGQPDWAADRTSEWFPALARRVSVTTPQGDEWIPDRAFARRVESHKQAQYCAYFDANCLARWSAETGIAFTHLYVHVPQSPLSNQCCALIPSLEANPAYVLVYRGSGVAIFVRR